jgi:hypothetical protein
MLKKILKAILGSSMNKNHHYTSDAWKKGYKHQRHSQYGHRHYKKMHRSHSSFFSSFFSS